MPSEHILISFLHS